MPRIVQRAFNGGELDPALHGRADQGRYATSCKTLRNLIATRLGPAESRAGTQFITEVKDSTDPVALLPFVFNDDQTYVLELGQNYIRFLQAGAPLTVSAVTAWNSGTTYAVGALASLAGVNYYCIAAHTNHTPPNATYWWALTGDIFEIHSPYDADEVADIRYIQSADVVTLFHPNHPPQELRRAGATDWTLVAVTTSASVTAPGSVVATAGVAPSAAIAAPVGLTATGGAVSIDGFDQYRVTAWDSANQAESAASAFATATVGVADAGHHIALAWTAVVGAEGYAVYKRSSPSGLGGTYCLLGLTNTNSWTDDATVTPAGPVKEAPLSATGSKTFTYKVTAVDETGVEGEASAAANCSGQAPTSVHPNHINWVAVSGAAEYNVYKADASGTYGYIGTANTTDFYDPPTTASATDGIEQDTTRQPPESQTLFASSGNYPSVGAYFQQRLGAANSDTAPETFWFSRTGAFHDFTRSTPTQDDDAITATLSGERVNAIRQMVTIGGKLIFGTQDGIWTAEGDTDGVIKPTAINLRQQVFGGTSSLRMLPIDSSALFISAHGNRVNDLRYSFQDDGYSGHEVSLFSQHLFDGYEIVDWAYQEHPDRLVWAARDDGVLLCMTFDREQQVWGWHRHDTGDGDLVERLCCVPEDSETALYLVVQRTIDGSQVRYIERMHSRAFSDITIDAVFVDCGLTVDGRYDGSTTIALSGGTAWIDETITATASAVSFTAADVGTSRLLSLAGEEIRVDITALISDTIVSCRPSRTVPVAMRNVALAIEATQVTTVTGLDHLEGRTVVALADGAVVDDLTVTGGELDLGSPATVVHVGLPYDQDFESLDVEDPQGQTLIGRRKRAHQATVLLQSSGPLLAGPDEDHLTEMQLRDVEDDDQVEEGAVTLATGPLDVRVQATWANNARLFLRNPYPLPVKILAVVTHGDVGE